MNVLSLFDGMSCGRIALERAGIRVDNYFSSEIDKHALKVADANWPCDTLNRLGDVIKIDASKLPKIDLLIGGSPCQGFSFAGKQLNFEDPRSKLFFEFVRLLKECKPKYFMLENVVMKVEFQNVITQMLGVEPIEINSNLVSAQNRKRLYWTNIPVSKINDAEKVLSEIVGEYEGIWVYPRGFNKGGVQSYKGKSPAITTRSWEHNFFISRKDGTRDAFPPEICEQLQTVPVGYTSCLSKSQRIKMLGNSWTVDVIAHILKGIQTPNV